MGSSTVRTQIEASPSVFVVELPGFEPVTPTLGDIPGNSFFLSLFHFISKQYCLFVFIYIEYHKMSEMVRFTKFSVVLQVLRM